ncbi:MAG: HD domain-containing protein [Saprospiraceae bacterium]|nr:HD domain-containing protein [Saprospiraceae bacterium]
MNQRRKIFNDPVYGFVSVPHGLLLTLIDHPYFQRLRRIRQLGLSSYVYPGALHTRFHHALGALHLMQETINVLRSKGVEITDQESEGVCVAILLHDIGHGPFSHALEHALVDLHHEALSLMFMKALNKELNGQLDLAIAIFTNQYPKKFLYQLVSGQLDMDRMDYLNRDSFFTGVSEGVIGYDRIIIMLDVHNGELVVEEKGMYSIEKFLTARRLMYWQVYLHKTGVAAEQMLIHLLARARELALEGKELDAPRDLARFLYRRPDEHWPEEKLLKHYARLDDTDLTACVKYWCDAEDPLLSYLSTGLLDRRLFRLQWLNEPLDEQSRTGILDQIGAMLPHLTPDKLLYEGRESIQAYNEAKAPIRILFKNGEVKNLTECSDVQLFTQPVTKYFVCYPKISIH